ncbi:acyltransferase family protein [Microbulbifer sp. TRSA001]|uniref:acyltransferase family protein n=1 Tax=Microbulbifer sp. TRSA001 TaxID=3243381 RepID=UPI00403A3953
MSSIGYRRDIDGLRALAVLPVVLAHAGLPGFSGGFVGVDIFFVISGYLITSILVKEIGEYRFSLANFYERRARRILPALFFVLATSIVAGWFVLPPDPFKELGQSALATLLFASNFWFWQSTEDYFGSGADWQLLLHTWSLSVEEQFYLFFPLLLCLLASRSRRSKLLVVAGLSILSLVYSVWATKAQPFANYFLTPSRVWELGLGALLALGAIPQVRKAWLLELVAAAGIAMILYSVFVYDSSTPFPGIAALLPCIGAAVLIWTGGNRETIIARLLRLRIIVAIGLISYSLYLWHWPVLVLLRLLNGSAELPLAMALVAIALSFILAWFSWRFVEAPFRRASERGLSRRGLALSLGAVGTLIMSVSLVINVKKGVPSRLPEPVYAAYESARSRTPEERRCMKLAPSEGLCEVGAPDDDSQVDYLLWGDSHAGAFIPGFEHWLEAEGYSGIVAAKSACAPLLDVIRLEMGASHGCDRFNEDVMGMLERRSDLGTVVLVARWALLAEGTRSPGEGGLSAVLGLAGDKDGPQINGAQSSRNYELFDYGLRQTIARIRASGRSVVIIEGIPEISFSVPLAIASAEFIGARVQAAPTLEQVVERNSRVRATLEALSEEFEIQRGSLVSELCPSECQIQMEGRSLYRDDNHLSTFGSEILVPGLMNRLLMANSNIRPGG